MRLVRRLLPFVTVLGLCLAILTPAALASFAPPKVPEIDAGAMTSALTVLSGGLLLVIGRRRSK